MNILVRELNQKLCFSVYGKIEGCGSLCDLEMKGTQITHDSSDQLLLCLQCLNLYLIQFCFISGHKVMYTLNLWSFGKICNTSIFLHFPLGNTISDVSQLISQRAAEVLFRSTTSQASFSTILKVHFDSRNIEIPYQ